MTLEDYVKNNPFITFPDRNVIRFDRITSVAVTQLSPFAVEVKGLSCYLQYDFTAPEEATQFVVDIKEAIDICKADEKNKELGRPL